jgi:hypothetical protein
MKHASLGRKAPLHSKTMRAFYPVSVMGLVRKEIKKGEVTIYRVAKAIKTDRSMIYDWFRSGHIPLTKVPALAKSLGFEESLVRQMIKDDFDRYLEKIFVK